jgi:hypothetical protein
MRIAIVAVALLSGCIIEPPDSGGGYPPPGGGDSGSGWGSGWGGGGGSSSYGCHADSDCGGSYVCARTGECLSATQVRIVRTTWTVDDAPASDTSCTVAPKLAITFQTGPGDVFGFAPVPCDAGKFTVDKLPTRFTTVSLTRVGDDYGGGTAAFDVEGNAAIDLPY